MVPCGFSHLVLAYKYLLSGFGTTLQNMLQTHQMLISIIEVLALRLANKKVLQVEEHLVYLFSHICTLSLDHFYGFVNLISDVSPSHFSQHLLRFL